MIPKECKRLAEVDFPIAVVSKHSAREKSIRHGHPSTLHLWWARRPLAACRSMLLALLLPDPCDSHCPEGFKEKARGLLPKVQGAAGPTDMDLRHALLKFIGDFANWDFSTNPAYLEVSCGLVKAAHEKEPPLVVDPFSGGGSIPLEALRLGCETFASDLNPVACLILKVMLEDIPRNGPKFVEDLKRAGAEVKEAAEKELAEFYPSDPDGAKPIAYLWARTVRCETPNCGAEVPLLTSFWLCKKAGRKRALKYKINRSKGKPPEVEFEIFEPKSDKDISNGTVTRAKATCLCCDTVLSPDRVRAQLREQRGGADVIFDKNGKRIGGAKLLAIVTINPSEHNRHYRLSKESDYMTVQNAMMALNKRIIAKRLSNGLSIVPDEPLPPKNTNSFRIPNYGMKLWSDIATARQKLALSILTQKLAQLDNGDVKELLALAVSRCSDFNSSLNSWAMDGEFVRSTFARQALSMVWDFCETMPLSSESGGYDGALNWVERVVQALTSIKENTGQVEEADACDSPLPDETAMIWFTDPPYYDAVGYAELSDFFFVWLKRALPGHPLLRDRFDPSNPLVPKVRECVQDENYLSVTGRHKDRFFFEETITKAFVEGRRVIKSDGIGSVVFAHKTTEGWEALLSGMIQGGWTITGSWPIATERPGRLRSQDSAALATSVHLVCRPRPENAQVGDWGDVLRELPNRVGDWMERLQAEGIHGADLVFACIGPALEIFSRYSKVESADGQEVKLAEYLEKVWEVVGRTALEHILGTAEAKARNGAAGALEEDARLTALFLWTLQSTNGESISSKDARTGFKSIPDFSETTHNEYGETKYGRIAPAGAPDYSSATDGERKRYGFIGRTNIAPAGYPGNQEDEDATGDINVDEETDTKKLQKGFSLTFDVARRFAQPLGIHLPNWEGRIIKTEKGVVYLLSISERAKILFGEEGAQAVADRLEKDPASAQLSLFETAEGSVPDLKVRGRKKKKGADIPDEQLKTHHESTTLDRVHAAMILQASGRANALRALLKAEQERGPEFLRLSNALTALYPKGSEEKRLLDAMLLAVPR